MYGSELFGDLFWKHVLFEPIIHMDKCILWQEDTNKKPFISTKKRIPCWNCEKARKVDCNTYHGFKLTMEDHCHLIGLEEVSYVL